MATDDEKKVTILEDARDGARPALQIGPFPRISGEMPAGHTLHGRSMPPISRLRATHPSRAVPSPKLTAKESATALSKPLRKPCQTVGILQGFGRQFRDVRCMESTVVPHP